MRRGFLAIALVIACTAPAAQGPQPSRDPIGAAMAQRIDGARQGTGAVAGLRTPEGESFASYGRASIGGQEVTADTIFEIGSITKVFTAFLLADMVERGEVSLDDPVGKYLPAAVTVPSRGRREMSLADLATHTSGLPRESVSVDVNSDTNPYNAYTAADLYAFLAGYRLQRDPGAQWEYSNVGFGLLGHALALRAGVSYEDLLRQRIFEPLAMTNTTVTLDAGRHSRRATGYNAKLLPLPPWSGGVVAPAGGVHSTVADLLTFGSAALDPQSPLKAVFARMTSVTRPTQEARVQQALGWNLFRLGANDIVAHSGGTFGFQSRLIIDTTRKRVVVAWINGRGPAVNDLVGLALDRATLGR